MVLGNESGFVAKIVSVSSAITKRVPLPSLLASPSVVVLAIKFICVAPLSGSVTLKAFALKSNDAASLITSKNVSLSVTFQLTKVVPVHLGKLFAVAAG